MKNTQKTEAPVVETLFEHLPEPFIDAVGGGVTYYGYAPIQTKEDEEGWRIVKKVVSGSVTKVLYSNGSMAFNVKWSDRATLVYGR